MLAKGMKRKRSEAETEPFPVSPSSSLFSLSVSKLHQSLQRIEPNLRHLVLVANTLRRLQSESQPTMNPISTVVLEATVPLAAEANSISRHSTLGGSTCPPVEACKSPLPTASPTPQTDELLLSNMDISIFSTLLEDLSGLEGFGDPLQPSFAQPDSWLSPEPTRTAHSAPPSPLEILGPGGYLLEDDLEDIFEDIDTSMYNSDLCSTTSLPYLKEGFSSPVQERSDLADLDYLMDVLVDAQEL